MPPRKKTKHIIEEGVKEFQRELLKLQFHCTFPECDGKSFLDAVSFQYHNEDHKKKEIPCDICQQSFTTEEFEEHFGTKTHIEGGKRRRRNSQTAISAPTDTEFPIDEMDLINHSRKEVEIDQIFEINQTAPLPPIDVETIPLEALPHQIEITEQDVLDDDLYELEVDRSETPSSRYVMKYLENLVPYSPPSNDADWISLQKIQQNPLFPYKNKPFHDIALMIQKFGLSHEETVELLDYCANTNIELSGGFQSLRKQLSEVPQLYAKVPVWKSDKGTLYLYLKPIMDFVFRIISTPLVLQHLNFQPVDLMAQDTETLQDEQAWKEFWTSETYKQMCRDAPLDVSSGRVAKVLAIFFEHDKTPLSKHGIHSAWPLIASVANAPLKLQGNPLFRDVIAYFPSLPSNFVSTKSHLSFCRMLLWHHCMKVVVASIANLPGNGCKVIRTSPSIFHFIQIKIAGMRCDLEQVYKLCRHFGANFEGLSSGCYRCAIPGTDLSKVLTPATQHPPLVATQLDTLVLEALELIRSGRLGSIGQSRDLMKKVSMHPIESGFRSLSYVNDNSLPLHDVDHITMGFFEMVIEFLEIMLRNNCNRTTNAAVEELDNRLITISSYCLIGERKFNHGAFDFPKNQWKIIRSLMRDLPFAFNGILKGIDIEEKAISLLVGCNSMLDEIDSDNPWTESRIERFQALSSRLQQDCVDLFVPLQDLAMTSITLSRPKFHLIAAHIPDVIRKFGTLKMGSSQFLERDHKTNSKMLYLLTNKHGDFMDQICKKMSQHFIEKLCRPKPFLNDEKEKRKEARVLGKGKKKRIGELMRVAAFSTFGERLRGHLEQCGLLPHSWQTLEDLMSQKISIFKSACFPRLLANENIGVLVFRASESYYGNPCFDMISFLEGDSTQFGRAKLIFSIQLIETTHFLIWIDEMRQIQGGNKFGLPCVADCHTVRLIQLQSITNLFAACPNFPSNETQFFLRPPKLSYNPIPIEEEEE